MLRVLDAVVCLMSAQTQRNVFIRINYILRLVVCREVIWSRDEFSMERIRMYYGKKRFNI